MKINVFFLMAVILAGSMIFGACAAPASAPTPAPASTAPVVTGAPKTTTPGATTPTPTTSAPASAKQDIKPLKLRVAIQSPPTAWGSTQAMVPWAKQVNEATKGRVQLEIFYSQTLAKQEDIWQAVITGVADMGRITHSVMPGLTPLMDVMTLPFIAFNSAKQGSGIMWKIYE